MGHACSPANWQIESRGPQILGQPGKFSETMLQNKTKKDWDIVWWYSVPEFFPEYCRNIKL